MALAAFELFLANQKWDIQNKPIKRLAGKFPPINSRHDLFLTCFQPIASCQLQSRWQYSERGMSIVL